MISRMALQGSSTRPLLDIRPVAYFAMAKTRDEHDVFYLVTDGREGSVIPFLNDMFANRGGFVRRQVTIGDYNICSRVTGQPVACFERKTLADFAASFRDGRYENIDKMIKLRAVTGCQLYYIIEGPAYPRPDRLIKRVRYSSIEAALHNMMVRHGIMVIHTEDEADTARRLRALIDVMEKEDVYAYPIDPAAELDTKGIEMVNTAAGGVPPALMAKFEQSDGDAAAFAWSRLKKVSLPLGKILSTQFSIAELARGEIKAERLAALKTTSGKVITAATRTSLREIGAGNIEACTKLLSGIRGVSPQIARHLITQAAAGAGGFRALCSLSAATLAIRTIPQKNRSLKLGIARATRILKILEYGAPVAELVGADKKTTSKTENGEGMCAHDDQTAAQLSGKAARLSSKAARNKHSAVGETDGGEDRTSYVADQDLDDLLGG